MSTILVISAHPDDETIGAGGTLVRHSREGDEVHWCIATQGFEPRYSPETLRAAAQQVEAASKVLGVKSIHKLGLPTTELAQIALGDLIEKVRQVLIHVQPHTVYTVGRGDIHSDHRVLFEAVLAATKPFRSSVKKLLSFECLSSTHLADPHLNGMFNPNHFVDISGTIAQKLDALRCYATELMPAPSPRSLEAVQALARFRGSCVNVELAEAFMIIREIR